jgi:pimeloyl-ACP methyl ester carboxylesterase
MRVLNSAGYSPLAPLFRVCDGVRVRFADNKADSSAVTVLMLPVAGEPLGIPSDLGPHVVGPDVGTAAALFLAANAPDRITSLTIGGRAVRVPIDAGGALRA